MTTLAKMGAQMDRHRRAKTEKQKQTADPRNTHEVLISEGIEPHPGPPRTRKNKYKQNFFMMAKAWLPVVMLLLTNLQPTSADDANKNHQCLSLDFDDDKDTRNHGRENTCIGKDLRVYPGRYLNPVENIEVALRNTCTRGECSVAPEQHATVKQMKNIRTRDTCIGRNPRVSPGRYACRPFYDERETGNTCTGKNQGVNPRRCNQFARSIIDNSRKSSNHQYAARRRLKAEKEKPKGRKNFGAAEEEPKERENIRIRDTCIGRNLGVPPGRYAQRNYYDTNIMATLALGSINE